jgi:hypothetical protein
VIATDKMGSAEVNMRGRDCVQVVIVRTTGVTEGEAFCRKFGDFLPIICRISQLDTLNFLDYRFRTRYSKSFQYYQSGNQYPSSTWTNRVKTRHFVKQSHINIPPSLL